MIANSPPGASQESLAVRLQTVARIMEQHFLDKQEIIRLLLISVVAGEHMVIVGPPGTAKSALVRMLSRLIDARCFEYLLTRFTEPNELFGPVDIRAFREGVYTRRTETMLPEAELCFLDEVFKSNSAILNSLLTLLNERTYQNGSKVMKVPLLALFGASNEVPNDESLAAIFDRFLLRVRSNNLDSYHFHRLLTQGLHNEILKITGREESSLRPIVSAREIHALHQQFDTHLKLSEDFLARYKGLIFQIRAEGISVSDRRVVKLLKLFAASAWLSGRGEATDADFFVLKHIWNNLDQAELLEEIVAPVVDRYHRDHPEERRVVDGAGLDELLSELQLIRERLTGGDVLSDIQLFSQLKNLNEIRAALQSLDSDAARRMITEIDTLLDGVFASSKFA